VDHRETGKFYSTKLAPELWEELVPLPETAGQHWDTLLHEITPDPDEPDAYHVKYTMGASLYENPTMSYLELQAPTHARYHHQGDINPRNRSLVEGLRDIKIEPHPSGKGCNVTIMSNRTAMYFREGLARWFDDALRDQTDHMLARQNGKRDWSMTGYIRRIVNRYA
jgi:hypothetical protein